MGRDAAVVFRSICDRHGRGRSRLVKERMNAVECNVNGNVGVSVWPVCAARQPQFVFEIAFFVFGAFVGCVLIGKGTNAGKNNVGQT